MERVSGITVIDNKQLDVAAERILKELSSHNIQIADLDLVFEMVKEKVNKMIIVQ